MIIQVIYANGQVGTVKPETLDTLLRQRRLYSFRRSNGWVNLQRDDLRRNISPIAVYPERRASLQPLQTP